MPVIHFTASSAAIVPAMPEVAPSTGKPNGSQAASLTGYRHSRQGLWPGTNTDREISKAYIAASTIGTPTVRHAWFSA
ncbi:hypothetical protein D3C76_1301400 [compost metagenome]